MKHIYIYIQQHVPKSCLSEVQFHQFFTCSGHPNHRLDGFPPKAPCDCWYSDRAASEKMADLVSTIPWFGQCSNYWNFDQFDQFDPQVDPICIPNYDHTKLQHFSCYHNRPVSTNLGPRRKVQQLQLTPGNSKFEMLRAWPASFKNFKLLFV